VGPERNLAPHRRSLAILLTDLLTTDVDDPRCSWTRPPFVTTVSRFVRQSQTDLDDRSLATDQKVGGSSPSERAPRTDRQVCRPGLQHVRLVA
jgi:hypothetical protein